MESLMDSFPNDSYGSFPTSNFSSDASVSEVMGLDPGSNSTDLDGFYGTTHDYNATVPKTPNLYYTDLYRIFSVVINVFIFLVGIIGNVLVVLVVARTRSMHTPTNCYLLSLAIADCLVLVSATLPAIPETFYQIDEWPFGRVMCSVLVFLQYLGVDVSSLSITAFTVERYIAICHPMKAQTMCTVKRAKRIILGIWAFGVLYCSPWLGLTWTKKQVRMTTVVTVCTVRLQRSQYLVYYMTDLIAFYAIPLFITTVLYALIAKILFMSPISKDVGRSQQNGTVQRTSGRKKQLNSRMQVVRMLAVIVGVFMTTWLPYRSMVVYNSLAKHKYMDLWFLLFCRTMVYINSAINPILYNAMSVKFRRAFKRILCCGFSTMDAHTSVYSEIHAENAVILARRPTESKMAFSRRSPLRVGQLRYENERVAMTTMTNTAGQQEVYYKSKSLSE